MDEGGTRTVWVVRHALSVGNAAHIFQGWLDLPLHPDGERAAESLKGRFDGEDIGHVISSPLRRAVRTAQLLFGRVDEIDAGWVEPAAPALQGMTVAAAAAARPDLLRADGWPREDMPVSAALETPASLRSRAEAALLRSAGSPGGGAVAVVTHGSLITALLHLLGAADARPENLHVLRIQVRSGGWTLEEGDLRVR